MLSESEKTAAKNAAGKAAADLVQDDMIVGLGTGSTAAFFIRHLIERIRQGLKITAIATSSKSMEMAEKGGIPMAKNVTRLDFTADGADEIDGRNRIIKGGGGALLREKVVASISEEWVVLIDPSKRVGQLKHPLPLEVLPFAHLAIQAQIESRGLKGSFRKNYITDNGNYIFDVHSYPSDVEKLNEELLHIPGVLETGLFFGLATKVIVGRPDGSTEIHT